jgi:spore coat protein CotH
MKERNFLAVTIFQFYAAFASICTETCDQANLVGSKPISLCGTDLQTHNTHTDALNCYRQPDCYVATYYQGTCGCPNECFAGFGQGICASDGVCRCGSGWSGRDCSLPVYGNPCSFHGTLVSASTENSLFPYDYCVCDEGFTGVDCSSTVFKGGSLPWGNINSSPKPYSSSEKYGDNHPIWNVSQLTVFRVKMDENDYLSLLNPANSASDVYLPANVTVQNNYVTESIFNVGMKIKGSMCRRWQKKCFAMKFNEFVSGQKLFGAKKISFKAGTSDDDILVRNMLYTDFLRALVTPTQRASYALLYVNDMFIGIYFIYEDMSADWVQSRIEDDSGSQNHLFKVNGAYLHYEGTNQSSYSSHYELDSGENENDWTDLTDWLYFFNSTSDKDFNEDLPDKIDLDAFIKGMVVESFLLNDDGMTDNGKNFQIYHLEDTKYSDNKKNKWLLSHFDFDFCFEYDENMIPEEPLDILDYFHTNVTDSKYNPLTARFLKNSDFTKQYLTMYRKFLDHTFKYAAQQPTERYAQLMQFILPWIARDRMWQLSSEGTADTFLLYSERSINNLAARYQNVTVQLNNYLTGLETK